MPLSSPLSVNSFFNCYILPSTYVGLPSPPFPPNMVILFFPHISILILLPPTGPVCPRGDGQSGGRTGQTQGKSSSSLGGTSRRQGLRPPCVPTIGTVPSTQQLNQGNTTAILYPSQPDPFNVWAEHCGAFSLSMLFTAVLSCLSCVIPQSHICHSCCNQLVFGRKDWAFRKCWYQT